MLTPLGAMRIAIDEARKGIGFVAPNPPVGCVILDKDGNYLAKGYHRRYGGDHAEIDALKRVKDEGKLQDAIVYVTLEPCAHEGKTSSCAKRLATLPIARVVYGLMDPYPLVRGKGLEILREAGIHVEQFDGLKSELENVAEVFLWNHMENKPFVSVKVATTLDGHLAHVSGDSKWLTGDDSRQHVHYLRAAHDAVLIGRGTFLIDKPSLNIRHSQFEGKKNKVVVMDSKGEGLAEVAGSNLLKCHAPEDIFWVVGPGAESISDVPVQLVRVPDTRDIPAVLSELYKREIRSILVEGGAEVVSSFLSSEHVNRLYQFIAPQILGGRSGLSYSRDLSVESLSDSLHLRNVETMTFGRDVMITGRLD